MRVFFDASVIIAALLSSTGGSSLLFTYIKSGEIVGVTTQTVIEEILEEDKRPKLKKSKEQIEAFVAKSGLLIREAITPDENMPYENQIDCEDAHLIAGAKLMRCTHLVSLDKKHVVRTDVQERFLPLKIVSPKELIEKIVQS